MTHTPQKDIFQQQVVQIFQQATAALVGMPAVAVVTVALLWKPHAITPLLIWLAIIFALSLVRLVTLIFYRRDKEARSNARNWAIAYALLEFCSGTTWAALVYWLFPQEPVDQALTMLILGAMAVGAMPMLTPVRWVYWAYLLPLGLEVTLALYFDPAWYSHYLLYFTLIFTLVLFISGQNMSLRNARNIELAIKNVNLVDSLKRANDRLERQFAQTKHAERIAREAEAQYRVLANATNEGVLLFKNMSIIDNNQQVCQMLGYDTDEIKMLSLNDLFETGNHQWIDELLRGDEATRFESQCRRKDYSSFPAQISKRSIVVDKNKIDIIAIYDISELKKMSEAKDQFISTVSHELRTPLTSIHASISMLKNGILGQLSDKQMEMINIASSNSERLKALVNDLLDIQRMDKEGLSFMMDKVDLSEMVRLAVEINQSYANAHQTRFIIGDDYDPIFIHADRNRLMQVLTNLLSNAAKFSPKGEDVSIEIVENDGTATTRIIDHGPGIPEEFQQRIFERFAQADNSDTRAHTGSGLGLHISKTIIEHMGGQIGYRTEAGKGTCFYFTLPIDTTPSKLS